MSMTHVLVLEEVGEFLGEPGAVAVGWTRWTEARRKEAVVWAELKAAMFLPEEELTELVKELTIASPANSIITTAAFVTALKILDIRGVGAGTKDWYFDYLPQGKLKLLGNYNMSEYGFVWYYVDTGIKLSCLTSIYAPSTNTNYMRIIKYPLTYENTWNSNCEFEGFERVIAEGAAAYLLKQDGDERWKELMPSFLAQIGATEKDDDS